MLRWTENQNYLASKSLKKKQPRRHYLFCLCVIKEFLTALYFYCPSFSIDCTGAEIEPYLPTLMDIMLSALNNSENLKRKELSVSAIGAIGKNSRRKEKFYRLKYPNSNNYIFVGNYDTEQLD